MPCWPFVMGYLTNRTAPCRAVPYRPSVRNGFPAEGILYFPFRCRVVPCRALPCRPFVMGYSQLLSIMAIRAVPCCRPFVMGFLLYTETEERARSLLSVQQNPWECRTYVFAICTRQPIGMLQEFPIMLYIIMEFEMDDVCVSVCENTDYISKIYLDS